MIKFMEVNTMNIFKKTNNKETKKRPMTGKVKKGFRAYCAVVLCMALIGCMSMTAFAAGGDPLTVINNLSDFIFGLILCKGNPHSHYRLSKETLKRGISVNRVCPKLVKEVRQFE